MEFSRQEYWSGLSFPSPRDLLDSGIEPASHASPVLADEFFTTAPGKPQLTNRGYLNCYDEDPKAKSLIFEKENYKHQD